MPELDYEDKLEVYVLLNKLIQSKLDSEEKASENENKGTRKAQIIVGLLKSTLSIIA